MVRSAELIAPQAVNTEEGRTINVARSLSLLGAAIILTVMSLGVGAVPSAVAQPAAADDLQTTWTVQPAGTDGPDDRISIRHELDPGAAITDQVVVTNFGPDAATFRIYASDGVVGAEGAFDILARGEASIDGGTWIALDEVPGAERDTDTSLTVDLDPEESIQIPFTIDVPTGALPGDHPAGVVAELVPVADQSVEFYSRVGVRLHLRTSGEVRAEVVATDVQATWLPSWNPFSSGTVRLDYSLHNVGNVRVGADSQVHLAGPFGMLEASAGGSQRELLPDQKVGLTSDLSLWGLFWSGGAIDVNVAPVGDDSFDAEPTPSSTSIQVWAIPWVQVATLLLVIAGLVLWRRRQSHAQDSVQRRIDAAVAAATADSSGATQNQGSSHARNMQ